MYINNTVFILGAGASWHYGQPTGEELVKKIINKANFLSEQFKGHNIAYGQLPEFLKEDIQNKGWSFAWNNFATQCSELVSRLRQVDPPVIDHFLSHHHKLQEIGKFMIAWVILQSEENFAKLGTNPNRLNEGTGLPISVGKDNWYRFILYQLLNGCKLAHDLSEKNKVTFITFNYDVSLEGFLYKGLKDADIVREKIDDFFVFPRFLHVYGKVYEDFKSPFYESYSIEKLERGIQRKNNEGLSQFFPCLDKIYNSSKSIQTIEDIDKDLNKDVLDEAKKVIRSAKCIYILGYGFDERNSERVGLRLGGRLPEYSNNSTHRVMYTNMDDSNRINKKALKLFEHVQDRDFLNGNKLTSGHHSTPPYYEKSIRNVYDALALDFDTLENYNFNNG